MKCIETNWNELKTEGLGIEMYWNGLYWFVNWNELIWDWNCIDRIEVVETKNIGRNELKSIEWIDLGKTNG